MFRWLFGSLMRKTTDPRLASVLNRALAIRYNMTSFTVRQPGDASVGPVTANLAYVSTNCIVAADVDMHDCRTLDWTKPWTSMPWREGVTMSAKLPPANISGTPWTLRQTVRYTQSLVTFLNGVIQLSVRLRHVNAPFSCYKHM